MIVRDFLKTVLCACLLPVPVMFAADDDASAVRRPSVGFRVEYYANRLFGTSTIIGLNSTNPVATSTYFGTAHSSKMELAPSVEYRLTNHLTLGLELHFHPAQFQQTTDFVTGIRDPNSSTDDRKNNHVVETTQVNYWEVPLVARYYGLRSTGKFRKIYPLGGVELRHLGRVRTGTSFSFANGTTDYNENPANPNHHNQPGAVVGLGYRVVDALRIKLTPEVRYVRWQGFTFQGPSYSSRQNQFEISLGLSY
jgi:hypothetical protein